METAARWHDRLGDGAIGDEERALFARWLAASVEHRRAYASVQRTHSALVHNSHDPRILELRHETALRLSRRPMRFSPWKATAVAAALILALGSLLIVLHLSDPPSSSYAKDGARVAGGWETRSGQLSYSTGAGERLTVTLEDGSQVTLNAETTLYAEFSKAQRHIELTRGQALFEVAKDPGRPFIVQAHDRQFIALGTAFDVRLDGDTVQITMVEGHVRVERTVPAELAAERPRREQTEFVATISAGEQLTVDERNVDRVDSIDAERVTSWHRGQLIFENSRLADAVDEFNRYSRTHIELGDAELEELRISGSFSTGRPQVFIEALTAYFPIQASYDSAQTVVLKSAD